MNYRLRTKVLVVIYETNFPSVNAHPSAGFRQLSFSRQVSPVVQKVAGLYARLEASRLPF